MGAGVISDKTVDLVHALRSAGVKFVIISGVLQSCSVLQRVAVCCSVLVDLVRALWSAGVKFVIIFGVLQSVLQ